MNNCPRRRYSAQPQHNSMTKEQVGITSFIAGMMFFALLEMMIQGLI